MTIIDTAWNDTTHVYGFTSSAEKFKDNLRKLPESGSENTGAKLHSGNRRPKILIERRN